MSTQIQSQPEEPEGSNAQMYYIIGAVVLVLVVAIGYAMRPKPATSPSAVVTPMGPTPTPGPITALGCEKQYYNPVIGFPRYYLSVEGVDVKPAAEIECEFNIEVAGKTVATDTVTSQVIEAPERGGVTFRCTTSDLQLQNKVPTTVKVALKDDLKAAASCSAIFSLP